MSEKTENLILEHLRALRAGQDRIEAKVSEANARLTSLESAVARSRSDNISTQEDVYRQQATIDRLTERVERIEKRLELVN